MLFAPYFHKLIKLNNKVRKRTYQSAFYLFYYIEAVAKPCVYGVARPHRSSYKGDCALATSGFATLVLLVLEIACVMCYTPRVSKPHKKAFRMVCKPYYGKQGF